MTLLNNVSQTDCPVKLNDDMFEFNRNSDVTVEELDEKVN